VTRTLKIAGRVLVTLLVVAAALWGARQLQLRYMEAPWTRDGRIRADVVQVTPDINGLITDVLVHNDQPVRRGQILFVIDQARYRLAHDQAQAAVDARRVALAQAMRENHRNRELTDLVSSEQTEQGRSKVEELRAALRLALVERDVAALNLQRTLVRASVNGVVTNVEVQPGDFAAAGRQVIALLNSDSIYVDGYFEETKLPRIRVHDAAQVRIMGVPTVLNGRVVSIAAGIDDRERMPSPRNLANINPTFSWVRLAQRVPVRVRLDRVPPDIRLIAGRTATVSILEAADRPFEGAVQ
jgi:RND family efflux transporter MFP subunit